MQQEDPEIEFVPLETLVQDAKVEGEGFDFLFGNVQNKPQDSIQTAFSSGFTNPTASSNQSWGNNTAVFNTQDTNMSTTASIIQNT